MLGYLELSVKAVVPIKISHSDTEEKQIKERPKTEEKHKNDEFLALKPITKTWNWSRLPTQSCKVPNKIYKTISLGKNGFSCLQFSRSGSHIAAAVLSKIVVHDILSGNEVAVLSSHIGFIYELDWSCDDKYLLSVSNDCRGAVWDINQTTPLFILPHPSYVYCGKWFGDEEHIVTGGKDHLLRYWSKNDDGFQLLEEIGGHSGFISSLACQDNSVIISGDSHGCIMVRKLSNDGWNLMKKLSFPEISQKVIDSILILCSKRRIIISVRSRSSYLVDIVSGIILQAYKSSINTYARSVSCLTPCGSFLFSFCQNGDVGIWEVNTGKMFASYDNLFPIDRLAELSGCIRYHPHEHMVGVIASVQNSPLLILKYELTDDDDTKRLGLKFSVK